MHNIAHSTPFNEYIRPIIPSYARTTATVEDVKLFRKSNNKEFSALNVRRTKKGKRNKTKQNSKTSTTSS